MGWGDKKTQTSTNSATTTPNLDPRASALYDQLGAESHNLIANANKPVYGDAQKADVLNNLNDLANASTKHLSSTLAGRGALGSGDFETGAGNIEQQRLGQLSGFYSQLPAMEDQAHLQRMMSALGFGAGLAGQMPVGQTSTGTGSSQEVSSPGWGSMVQTAIGAMAGGLTGGMMGGPPAMPGNLTPISPMYNPSAMPAYGQLPMQLTQRPIPFTSYGTP